MLREFLVEAAGHHRARTDEVAVNEDLHSADREVGEAVAQRGEVGSDLVAAESAGGAVQLIVVGVVVVEQCVVAFATASSPMVTRPLARLFRSGAMSSFLS